MEEKSKTGLVEQEVGKRRDDALRRALSTPPKPKQESTAESKKKEKKGKPAN